MIDLKSVSMSGAFNVGRARVLWQNGLMKIWGVKGHLVSVHATEPKKIKGYLARWESETENGPIVIRAKCVGCGGHKWWKFLLIGHDELWETA